MRIPRLALAAVLISAVISPLVNADMMGADLKVLVDVYATLKKQLDEIKHQVDELKVANESIQEVRDGINTMKEQYEFVRDFDPQAEINSIKYWGKNITGLGDLGEARTFDEKWRIIQKEINDRVEKGTKHVPQSVAKANDETIRQLVDSMRETDRQAINYHNASNASSNSDNARYLEQLNASSAAMTASLLLEEKQARLEAELRRREKVLEQVQWEGEFLNYLAKDKE